MRFGWSTDVCLGRDSFSLSFSLFRKGWGWKQKHRRESGLGSGGGPSKASDSCVRAGGPGSAPGVGEEAKDRKDGLTFSRHYGLGPALPEGLLVLGFCN